TRTQRRERSMRTACVALLLLLASARSGAAQTGQSTDVSRGLLGQPRILSKGIDIASQLKGDDEATTPRSNGFYPEMSNMITGAGWISLGPGYRHLMFDRRAFIDGSAAVSWRGYKMAQGRLEMNELAADHLTLGSQIRWQDLTQIDYFGIGAAS